LWASALTSCRTAADHLALYHKKGGTFTADTVSLSIHDTLIINGDTIIQNKEIKVPCPESKPETPPTKAELRNDRKSAADSMAHAEKMYKLKIKEMESDYNSRIKKAKTNTRNDLKLKDKEIKQLQIQLKAEQKRTKSSVFWTKIGRLWWMFVLIGSVGTLILIIWIRRKA
jgi:hypothetical protein